MSPSAADPAWLLPDWPAPARVRVAVSTRWGPGVSSPPFERFNLGARNGDAAEAVAHNRRALRSALALPGAPHWLRQVHGTTVHHVHSAPGEDEPVADAVVTRLPGQPLAILTADCLSVLFASMRGDAIGAAHAGWRGLAGGVLESTLDALCIPPAELLVWLGPCIGMASYEVGVEVHAAFTASDAGAAACFEPTRPGHWRCDLVALARRRLVRAGVTRVHGGGFDTCADPRLYSYRRDGAGSGRFATLIWLD